MFQAELYKYLDGDLGLYQFLARLDSLATKELTQHWVKWSRWLEVLEAPEPQDLTLSEWVEQGNDPSDYVYRRSLYRARLPMRRLCESMAEMLRRRADFKPGPAWFDFQLMARLHDLEQARKRYGECCWVE